MTKDEIIRMAQEAGFRVNTTEAFLEELERFAALIASAEREACAKVCDEIYFQNYPDAEEWEQSEEGEAIRKRSHV